MYQFGEQIRRTPFGQMLVVQNAMRQVYDHN